MGIHCLRPIPTKDVSPTQSLTYRWWTQLFWIVWLEDRLAGVRVVIWGGWMNRRRAKVEGSEEIVGLSFQLSVPCLFSASQYFEASRLATCVRWDNKKWFLLVNRVFRFVIGLESCWHASSNGSMTNESNFTSCLFSKMVIGSAILKSWIYECISNCCQRC